MKTITIKGEQVALNQTNQKHASYEAKRRAYNRKGGKRVEFNPEKQPSWTFHASAQELNLLQGKTEAKPNKVQKQTAKQVQKFEQSLTEPVMRMRKALANPKLALPTEQLMALRSLAGLK